MIKKNWKNKYLQAAKQKVLLCKKILSNYNYNQVGLLSLNIT